MCESLKLLFEKQLASVLSDKSSTAWENVIFRGEGGGSGERVEAFFGVNFIYL